MVAMMGRRRERFGGGCFGLMHAAVDGSLGTAPSREPKSERAI